ncbi:hypothetical protein MG296_12765 [Flavobacteriaceae bacterium TK19130]|nr:hypothetical protein [Thermobacterium salinum]
MKKHAMLPKTNLKDRLAHIRNRRVTDSDILQEVHAIFKGQDEQRERIKKDLSEDSIGPGTPLNFDLLESDRIFHIKDIERLCYIYRLRFLDSSFFKGTYPEEAITKIARMEKEHDTSLNEFKIVAPAKRMKLENADDPLLFTPMGNDYFYLIHKWGNDLHPFRKLLMWPYRSFENLVIAILFISIALTAITPMQLFTHGDVTLQEYFLMFLFMFKAVGGIVLFIGFAKGKNFNGAIWNSKYYNA